jgi:hypothetical protein
LAYARSRAAGDRGQPIRVGQSGEELSRDRRRPPGNHEPVELDALTELGDQLVVLGLEGLVGVALRLAPQRFEQLLRGPHPDPVDHAGTTVHLAPHPVQFGLVQGEHLAPVRDA